MHDAVPIICGGWAASVVMLSDGRRQILSFLLPGDMVSTALLFEPRPNYQVEAITEVRYRMLRRAELKDALFKHAAMFAQVRRPGSRRSNVPINSSSTSAAAPPTNGLPG